MRISLLGLDPGLANTGWALLEGDTVTGLIKATEHYGVIKTVKWRDKGKKIELPTRDRLDLIALEIQKLIAEHEPTYVVMEDFVYFGNKGATTSTMPVLIETIRMLSKQMGYEAIIFANGVWKKILLKNHVANKNQVQHCIHRRLNLDTKTWDKLDKGGHIRDAMSLALTQWEFVTSRAKKPVKRQVIKSNWGK